MVEYWSEQSTAASWLKLQELRKEYDFTVIGGWAVYLWTKAMKSKDIDFITSFETLEVLRNTFTVEKNDILRKYQVKFPEFDLDIYLPFYSKLALPPQDILSKYARKTEGFSVASPEALLVLKGGAEIDRRNTPKGRKDAIDIVLLCTKAGVDYAEYEKILEKYSLSRFSKELAHVIRSFPKEDLHFIGMGFLEFSKWRKKTLAELARI